ncbi:MAG TPA: hypothetical protein VNI34_10140 [Candidatus Nitrosotalea sp.]|nr:hypothetical protein [Candidatus Nitrosotalea sp.]
MADTTMTSKGVSTTIGWRSRLGWRTRLAALAILLLLVAAIGANLYLTNLYGPQGAARQYLAALGSGDANALWALINHPSAPTGVQDSLLDRAALNAALEVDHSPITNVTVDPATIAGSVATVSVSYRRSGAISSQTLTLSQGADRHLGIYPTWRVDLVPALLSISLPPGGGGLTVDGRNVEVGSGSPQTIAVFPLHHTVNFAGNGMVEAASQDVASAAALSSGKMTVAFPTKLTAAGLAKAQQGIKDALAACAAATEAAPNGCPQSAVSITASHYSWKLVGDPTADLTLTPSPDGTLKGTGHYVMILTYQPVVRGGTEHQAFGGDYSALLVITGTDIKPTSMAAGSGIAALPRPAGATDQAAKDLVGPAIAKCGSAAVDLPDDCPQSDFDAFPPINHPQWSLSGDPLSAAVIAWDGAQGILTVSGPFQMFLDYGDSLGENHHDPSTTKSFQAQLVWDGSALNLVTILGALS